MDDRYSAKARKSKLDDMENRALGTGKYAKQSKPKAKPKAKKKPIRQKLDDDFWS